MRTRTLRLVIATVGGAGVAVSVAMMGCASHPASAPAPAAPPRTETAAPNPTTTKKTAAPQADATIESIALGDVIVALSWSRTAAVFHAVDQLSGWSPFSHPQYAKWAPSPRVPEDDALLAKHAALRTRIGRERGLEKALYLASSSPRKALESASRAGIMTKSEAEDESVVLETWSTKLEAHLASDAVADELRKNLRGEAPAFERLAKRWLAIADLPAPSQPIPLVVVPSPGQGLGGGGANGGIIVIEVPEQSARATLTTVGHELVHALVRPRWDRFEKAASKCGHGVDAMTISEGIAYAMAPGLFAYDGGVGTLEKQAAQYTGSDHPYTRFTKIAIALKPTVAKMLTRADGGERGMLDELLEAACTASAN